MKIVAHQAVIGIAIAAALTIGAGVNNSVAPRGYAAWSPLASKPASYVIEAVRAGADTALDLALNVYGEAVGHLKQM